MSPPSARSQSGPPSQVEQRPLDFSILRRLFGVTGRPRQVRNALIGLVSLRAVQLPLVTWATARVISGPIAERDGSGTLLGALGFLALAAFTEFCFVYRMRMALELGERVVQDLRNAIYAHLLRLPMSFDQGHSNGVNKWIMVLPLERYISIRQRLSFFISSCTLG